MIIWVEKTMQSQKSTKEFYKQFSEKTGDTVNSVVLAKISGVPSFVLNQVGLSYPKGQDFLWGLLILGEKDIHFFVHPSEGLLVSMFRATGNGEAPKEQYVRIEKSSLADISPEPVRKTLIPLFSPQPKVILISFYTPQSEKITLPFEPINGLKKIMPLFDAYKTK